MTQEQLKAEIDGIFSMECSGYRCPHEFDEPEKHYVLFESDKQDLLTAFNNHVDRCMPEKKSPPYNRERKYEAAIRAVQRDEFDGELGKDFSLMEVGVAAVEEFWRLKDE